MSKDLSKKTVALAQENDKACAFENLLLGEFNRRAERLTEESLQEANEKYAELAGEAFLPFDSQGRPPLFTLIERIEHLAFNLRLGLSGFPKLYEDDEMRIESALALPRFVRYCEYEPKVGCEDPEDIHSYVCRDVCSSTDLTEVVDRLNTALLHVAIYGSIRAQDLNNHEADMLFAEAACAIQDLYALSDPEEHRDAKTCKRIVAQLLKGVQLLWFAGEVESRRKEIESTSKLVAKMAQKAQLGPHAKRMGVKEVDFEKGLIKVKGVKEPLQFPMSAAKCWKILKLLLSSTHPAGYVSITDEIKPGRGHFRRPEQKTPEALLLNFFYDHIDTLYSQGEHGRAKGDSAIFLKPLDSAQIKKLLAKDK